VKLSILMPVYNEVATLERAVKEALAVDYRCEFELVIVDDGSTDGTRDLFPAFAGDQRISVHMHDMNRGKGAAVRTAVDAATGDYMITLDADLEYVPGEIPLLLEPVLRGEAEVVFGVRTFSSHNSYSYLYVLGNKAVTTATNLLFNCYLRDVETCNKLIPASLYRELDIRETGFATEVEVTAKMLHRGIRPYEVPISYKARSREAGKKITWRDGVEAIAVLLRLRYSRRSRSY
jgi:glycosyltransferase involved in cell wall biosynthesis